MPLLGDSQSVYVGTTPITTVMAGTQKVWPIDNGFFTFTDARIDLEPETFGPDLYYRGKFRITPTNGLTFEDAFDLMDIELKGATGNPDTWGPIQKQIINWDPLVNIPGTWELEFPVGTQYVETVGDNYCTSFRFKNKTEKIWYVVPAVDPP